MKILSNRVLQQAFTGLIALGLMAGCASTKVTDRQSSMGANERLPKPTQIWVHDFAGTPADVPAESALAGLDEEPSRPPTAEQVQIARQLGESIATHLVDEIRDLGMMAVSVSPGTKPSINDLVIRGYLMSIDEGSAAKRVVIGFGAGASELKTAVEVFQMTDHGLRKLGSGTVDAGGSKGPGAALGVATFIATANPAGLIISSGMKVYGEASGSSKIEGRGKATAKEIADVLKKRFREQGWID